MNGLKGLHESEFEITIEGKSEKKRGIIHRDLKPDNIMLLNDSSNNQRIIIKIIDFKTSTFIAKDSIRNTFSGTFGFIV